MRIPRLECCLSLVILFATLAPLLPAQEASKRRIVVRTAPSYPSLARGMALAGVVKIAAAVAPDGTVKMLDVKGGHPVLAQAAVNAVRQWKWEPSAHESLELIEIHFSPPE
jgi:TonB family protein